MPIKRAILISIVAYVATFISTLVLAQLVNMGTITIVGNALWFTGEALSVLVMFLATWWYFSTATARPNAKNGLLFGVITLLTGCVLDIVSLLPTGNVFGILAAYYLQPLFLVSLALVVATTTLTAFVLQRRAEAHNARLPMVEEEEGGADIPMNDDIRNIAEADETNV